MATVIPPLLPLEAPNDNEQSLWTMIIAMRRALFGLGGPLTIFAGNQGTGGSGGAGGVPCEDTNPCSGSPVFQSQGGIPNGDSDTFNRAALCGTANNLGGPWIPFTGGDNGTFCIVQDATRDQGGALRVTGPTTGLSEVVYHNGDWADDQQVSLFFASSLGTLPAPSPQVGLRINPCTLSTASPNNGITGYMVKPSSDSNVVTIVRYTSGTASTLFSAGDGSGDPQSILPKDTLTVSIVGATITVKVIKGVNWPLAQQGATVTRVTFTDTTPLKNGRVGFIQDLSFASTKNADIQNWVGTSLGTVISGGACGGGNPNSINPTNAGTVLVLTSGGQIGWPCKETLLVDAVNRRIVGSSQPQGNLTLASTCNAVKGRVIIQNPDTLRIGSLTQGSVLFAGLNGDVSQDNANFFYDQPNTQLRVPKIAGGTAATSSLTLQSTTGVGTTDFIKFLVGNAGGTEAMRILDSGFVGISTAAPATVLQVGDPASVTNTIVTIDSGAAAQTAIVWNSAGTRKWVIYRPANSNDLRIFDSAAGLDRVAFQTTTGFMGIATNAPNMPLDINGAYATRKLDVPLANGANNNVAISTFSLIRIIGPTAAYQISGFVNGFDGRVLYLFNSVAFALTIQNNNAGSAAANQITTLTGADVTLRAGTSYATFIYDGATSKWILSATN